MKLVFFSFYYLPSYHPSHSLTSKLKFFIHYFILVFHTHTLFSLSFFLLLNDFSIQYFFLFFFHFLYKFLFAKFEPKKLAKLNGITSKAGSNNMEWATW